MIFNNWNFSVLFLLIFLLIVLFKVTFRKLLFIIFKIGILFLHLFVLSLKFLFFFLKKIINERKLLKHFIRLLTHYYFGDSLPVFCPIIDSCVISVFISDLRQVFNTRVSHLDQRSDNGSVICIVIECAIFVAEIIFKYFFKNIREKCHKVGSYKTEIVSKFSLTKLGLSDLSSKTKRSFIIGKNFQEVTVNKSSLFWLIYSIIKL